MKFSLEVSQHGIDLVGTCSTGTYSTAFTFPAQAPSHPDRGVHPEDGLYDLLLPFIKKVEESVREHERTNDHTRRKL